MYKALKPVADKTEDSSATFYKKALRFARHFPKSTPYAERNLTKDDLNFRKMTNYRAPVDHRQPYEERRIEALRLGLDEKRKVTVSVEELKAKREELKAHKKAEKLKEYVSALHLVEYVKPRPVLSQKRAKVVTSPSTERKVQLYLK